MKTIDAKDAQNNFKGLMDEVIKEPIIINEQGKSHVALISFKEFIHLLTLDDTYYWQRFFIEHILASNLRKTNIPLCADYRGLPYNG